MSLDAEKVLELLPRLDQYLSQFRSCAGPENFEHLCQYARGQLGPVVRKSIEPIALSAGLAARTLQEFMAEGLVDDDQVRRIHHGNVMEEMGSAQATLIVDATSDAKKGTQTAGVARQYCNEKGKVDNCIVTVHLGYVSGDKHAMLDGELYLPHEWDLDPKAKDYYQRLKRRLRVGIGPEVGYRGEGRIALEQIKRALANGVQAQWVTADEAYGKLLWWRGEIEQLGMWYVLGVPRSTLGWLALPQWSRQEWVHASGEKSTRPVPCPKAQPVEQLAKQVEGPWQPYVLRDTKKGPELWEFKQTPFYASRCAQRRYQGPQRLLIGRNVASQETSYFLCNAPEWVSLEQVLGVLSCRPVIERMIEDCKGELGMNHGEMRIMKSLNRHLLFTAVAYLFLLQTRQEWGEKGGRAEHQPVGRCHQTHGRSCQRWAAQ